MGISKPKDEYAEKLKEEKKKIAKPVKIEKKKEIREIVRLANTDLEGSKPLRIALQGIKGIGHSMSRAICIASGLSPNIKLGSLSENELERIEEVVKDPAKFGIPSFLLNRRRDIETGKDLHLTGSEVEIARKFDIQRYIELKTYRGWRHMLGQPVRGQRTRSHFRTGRVVGVVRKRTLVAAKKEEKK